jgi:hypothetical protein
LENLNWIGTNDELVLFEGTGKFSSHSSPPRPIQTLRHYFEDDNLLVTLGTRRPLPGALSWRTDVGGDAAELLGEYGLDVEIKRLLERSIVIVIDRKQYLRYRRA